MSDDDRKIDIENDDDDDSDSKLPRSRNLSYYSRKTPEADKRAHHNKLERNRRYHINDIFTSLKNAVPTLEDKSVSQALIIKNATEYIQYLKKTNHSIKQEIEHLVRQNTFCEARIRMLKATKTSPKKRTKTSPKKRCKVQKLDISFDDYNRTESNSSDSEE